ncbi:MAG: hypothetical protein OXE76_04010 [Alphaproteobacteria bacterium]|nr:hypothetical protein [Alphaproteobacteria bacterium]
MSLTYFDANRAELDPQPGSLPDGGYSAYASIGEADRALVVDPVRSETWAGLSDTDKAGRLINASDRLDILQWSGERAGGPTQARAWPREGMRYADGSAVPATLEPPFIPAALERACILLAGTIAITPQAADHGSSASNIESLQAGSVRIRYFRSTTGAAPTAVGVPLQDQSAHQLIALWLGGQSEQFAPAAYGTDARSSFSDADRYDRDPQF